jgi:phage protein U
MISLPLLRKSLLAKLDDFVFEPNTATFGKIDRESSYRWVTIELFGQLPAKQFLGPDSEKLTLSGKIYPHHRGGLGQIAKLREMAKAGKPYLLIMTDSKIGQNMGWWVIKSIKETRTLFLDNGVPQLIEFTLDLEQYGNLT